MNIKDLKNTHTIKPNIVHNDSYLTGYIDGVNTALGVRINREQFEGMTNGEVIKITFPNADYEAGKQFMHITNINSIGEISVPLDWWNAPYKAESEGTE